MHLDEGFRKYFHFLLTTVFPEIIGDENNFGD